MNELTQFVVVMGFIALAVLWIGSIIWAARDAEFRGKSGILVGLLVLLLPWPIGVIAWIAFRPENYEPDVMAKRFRRRVDQITS